MNTQKRKFNLLWLWLEGLVYTGTLFLFIWLTKSSFNEPDNASHFFMNVGVSLFSIVVYFYLLYLLIAYKGEKKPTALPILASSLILSFPVTYYILTFGNALVKSNVPKLGSADGWLGFIGNILSVLITIAVVHPMISGNNREKINKEDLDNLISKEVERKIKEMSKDSNSPKNKMIQLKEGNGIRIIKID
ncbi:hypothetical protein G7059_08095 [Erysipelothrix sp. HDW6A]|uniref:hypothetical protein n=1 Tax=Erysipelothrix sp. HDW6A TaxID=2714928 RepID=UPI00140C30D0|nr:hypothetical protein [Erysipelothrix sp. HDW6A]QIK57803.1 hypothetical protein G7059_08095 [Erysipelothrix sp. HDW6A]